MKKMILGIVILLVIVGPIFFSLFQRDPKGISFKGDYHQVNSIAFLTDLTYTRNGETIHELNILDYELTMIKEAQEFILIDMFLFNDGYDRSEAAYPPSVNKISEALIEKKTQNPELPIVFITDPINGFYGAYEEDAIKNMRENGIDVIITKLNEMKDSNPLFSGYYRTYLQWFGTKGKGWIENPTDPKKPDVKIRNFLKLLNLKANHRKLLVTEKEGVITSANPHDPSSYHSNIAMVVEGPVLTDVIQAERSVAAFSGVSLPKFEPPQKNQTYLPDTKVRYLTEKAMYERLLACIEAAEKDDKIQIGIFYLSEFAVINALEGAAERGVLIEIIADPNKNAFGVKMNGAPNCQSLSKIGDKWDNLTVKWYNIGEEQYHVKLASFSYPVHQVILMGSSNYTRRNLKGYNLESDLEVVTVRNSDIARSVNDYFDRLWSNTGGDYTVEFGRYVDHSFFKYKLYQIQEVTGLCSY